MSLVSSCQFSNRKCGKQEEIHEMVKRERAFNLSAHLQTLPKAFLYEIVTKLRVRKMVEYCNTLDSGRRIGELERGKDF